MPAITVNDVLALPRLAKLDPAGTVYRPVRRLTTAQNGFEGEGFPVRHQAGRLGTIPAQHLPHTS